MLPKCGRPLKPINADLFAETRTDRRDVIVLILQRRRRTTSLQENCLVGQCDVRNLRSRRRKSQNLDQDESLLETSCNINTTVLSLKKKQVHSQQEYVGRPLN